MKKSIYLAFVILSFAIFACNKSKSDVILPAPTINTDRIKTHTINGYQTSYTYDNQGRLVETFDSNSGTRKYIYETGKVISKFYDTLNVLTSDREYLLSANGKMIKETSGLNPGLNYSYTYDNQNNLLESNYINGAYSSSKKYFFSKGNADSIRNYDKNGQLVSTVINTFDLNKLNTISEEFMGLLFMPVLRKNILTKQEFIYANGTPTKVFTFEYEFDSKGRVIKMDTYSSGNFMSSDIITYK